jgi:hypothetical protein
MKKLACCLAVATIVAAPAYSTCALTDISPTALQCVTVTGNVLGGSDSKIQSQIDALASLGFSWDGDWQAIIDDGMKLSNLNGATILDFGVTLNGISFLGVHYGAQGGGETDFYKFDAGTGLQTITLNRGSSSGAVLYDTGTSTPVPEPVSWALMLGGFGAIGGVMRVRRREVSFG